MKKLIKEFLQDNILILDGSTGTEMQKKGMPAGVCPELWILENPHAISETQIEYVNAGSNAVLAPTFGCNAKKLEEYSLENRIEELNQKLFNISKNAVGDRAFVLADISSTGSFIEPFGSVKFEDAVNIYKQQVEILDKAGADGFFIETMTDIQEARAALIAVKETCNKFVFVSMTYDETGRTLTGTDPVTATITLQSLGADAVGMNCSTGPDKMLEYLKSIKEIAKVFVFAKPNAGMPKLKNGKTYFDMDAKEFAKYAPLFAQVGVNAFGGCCGTTPEYIKEVAVSLKGFVPVLPLRKTNPAAITSVSKTVFIGKNYDLKIIGERINPTGKKAFKDELIAGKTDMAASFATEQNSAGAHILDVNTGAPGADEKTMMDKIISMLVKIVDNPLCIDSSDAKIFEEVLRKYPGRALMNSISCEKEKYENLLPVAAKYGAKFILLPLSDKGIPQTAEERINLITDFYCEAQKCGISKDDIVVDALVMTVSTGHQNAQTTLEVLDWAANKFGINTILGLSNVSFGLPNRALINSAFLAMAASKGLSSVIINPNIEESANITAAINVLRGSDKGCVNYINKFSGHDTSLSAANKEETKTSKEKLFDDIVKGREQSAALNVKKCLDENISPEEVVNAVLLKALDEVGRLYEEKKYFLPQLMMSAQAMQLAFGVVEPLLKQDSKVKKGKIVFATVKGDIHDIGKNICILMLKNNGFDVVDLGKDVAADVVVDAAIKENANIIALSALMTTTMTEMPKVVELVKSKSLNIKIMIGGAVVDSNYANEIGADGFSLDGHGAVKEALRLMS